MIVHAGLIALRDGGQWRGVLIQGPSGCGKSDLALRAATHGFRLVADDRVIIFTSKNSLYGRAPGNLRNLVEVRGVGVVATAAIELTEIALVASCVEPGQVERLPDRAFIDVLGIDVPAISICPLEASAPAKLCRALEVLGRGAQEDYDAAFPRTAPRDSM